MSDFVGARIKPKNNNFNIGKGDFAGARIKPKKIEVIEEDLSPSYLDRAKQFGSGVLSGVSRSGMHEAADQFGAGVMEVAPGLVAPIQPESAIAGAESAEKGLEALESMKPAEDDGIGNVLYKAGEFGGAAASMPIPGAGATGVTASAASKVASTMPREIPKAMLYLASKYGVNPTVNTVRRVYNTPFGEGATIGAGSGLLQEGGVDPLVADLTSMVFTPTVMRTPDRIYQTARHPLKNVAYPLSRWAFDINKNNFNLKAAEAADRLGVDLNLSELNPSGNIALVNSTAAKNYRASDAVRLHNTNIDNKIKDIIEENLNLVGPQKTKEVEKLIDKKYNKTRRLFPSNPEDRMIIPKHSVEALQEGFNTTSLSPSPSETAVLNYKQKILDKLNPKPDPELLSNSFLDKLKNIGLNHTPSSEEIGASIKNIVSGKYKKLKKKREDATSDLYNNLVNSKNYYPTPNFKNQSKKNIQNTLGETEKTLNKFSKELDKKNLRLSVPLKKELVKLEKDNKTNIDLNYINPEIKAKIIQNDPNLSKIENLKYQIKLLKKGEYRPIHIDQQITEIQNEIQNNIKKGINKKENYYLSKQAEALKKDLELTPEGLSHRKTYKEYSPEINLIEEDKFLSKLIDEKTPNEKIGESILKLPNKNIKNLITHIKDTPADLIKSYIRSKYLTNDGGLPTYISSSNFLNKDKVSKLKYFLNKNELDTLIQTNNYLKNRKNIDLKNLELYKNNPLNPIDAQVLYDTKISLNSKDPNNVIRYNNPETNVRNNAKKFGRGYKKDLEILGERYPEWYKSFVDADKFFGDVASRENFENALINGGFNSNMFNYQPGMMSKNLNSPKKLKKIQHTYKNKPKATKDKLDQNLEDLGIISDAMVKRNKSNPNPSGTALLAANIGKFLPTFFIPKFLYNNVVDNKNLIADTIYNMKNPKPKIPFKNKLINSRINYVYPTINNIKNRED